MPYTHTRTHTHTYLNENVIYFVLRVMIKAFCYFLSVFTPSSIHFLAALNGAPSICPTGSPLSRSLPSPGEDGRKASAQLTRFQIATALRRNTNPSHLVKRVGGSMGAP